MASSISSLTSSPFIHSFASLAFSQPLRSRTSPITLPITAGSTSYRISDTFSKCSLNSSTVIPTLGGAFHSFLPISFEILYISPILPELHAFSHSSILSRHHSLSTLLRNCLIFRLARPNCSFTTTHSLSNLANSPPPLRTLNLLLAFTLSCILFLSLISLSISSLISFTSLSCPIIQGFATRPLSRPHTSSAASFITSTKFFHCILPLSPFPLSILSFHLTLVLTLYSSFFSESRNTSHLILRFRSPFTALHLLFSTQITTFLGLWSDKSFIRSHLILLIIRCLSLCLTTNPSNSYHLPYILLNHVPLSACLTKLFAYANPFASHHSIRSLPASFILPTPNSPHTPFLALPLPTFAFQSPPINSLSFLHILNWLSMSLRQRSRPTSSVIQTGWYTATNLTPPIETAVTLSYIHFCCPSSIHLNNAAPLNNTPRLPTVHQSRPVLVLPHPDHPLPLPKKLRNQDYLPFPLLHPLSHPP